LPDNNRICIRTDSATARKHEAIISRVLLVQQPQSILANPHASSNSTACAGKRS
jgi:hypothetical protein